MATEPEVAGHCATAIAVASGPPLRSRWEHPARPRRLALFDVHIETRQMPVKAGSFGLVNWTVKDPESASLSPFHETRLMDKLNGFELVSLLDFCEYLLFSVPDFWVSRRRYLDIIGWEETSTALKVLVGIANRHAYAGCSEGLELPLRFGLDGIMALRREVKDTISRKSSLDEGSSMTGLGRESDVTASSDARLLGLPDDEFIFRVHEVVLGRACRPLELVSWRERLGGGRANRSDLLEHAFGEAARVERETLQRNLSTAAFGIMGTDKRVTEADWRARAKLLTESAGAPLAPPPRQVFIRTAVRPVVSIITSLYRGAEHIERFMANMVAQQGFGDHAELIIVDANSPDGERATVERYASRHPNIRYLRQTHRIGIYDAWNLAISEARGIYLTNANVDDLRRSDSIGLQAATLDSLADVDIVYQDFFYTMDPHLSYEQVAQFGLKSELPSEVNAEVLMSYNPPHHAPMWRKSLHDELGVFDTHYQSAGDYEFWLRCLAAGKTFFKIDDPHAVYYQNPKGVSTRALTIGPAEANAALRRHGRRLLASLMQPGLCAQR